MLCNYEIFEFGLKKIIEMNRLMPFNYMSKFVFVLKDLICKKVLIGIFFFLPQLCAQLSSNCHVAPSR